MDRPFVDLGFARVDTDREARQGAPEAIMGEGKTPEEISGIARALLDAAREAMGPIAEAFALDQRFTSEKAHSELGWALHFDDPLGELSRPG